jgi:hypothetical protein
MIWDELGSIRPDASTSVAIISIVVDARIPNGCSGVLISVFWMAEFLREDWHWWVHGIIPEAFWKCRASLVISN